MNAEYFVVNDCGNWEAVEALDKLLPELETVSSLALIVESIDTVDRATFMIASQQKEVFRVLDLVCHHKADYF